MRRHIIYTTSIFLIFGLLLAPANFSAAATGDFLFKFGAQYHFQRPCGITADTDGMIYMVDGLFNYVHVFNDSGTLLRKIDGPSYLRGFTDVAVDGSGNIYVLGYANVYGAIMVFNSAGELIMQFAPEGSGDGELMYPTGIAVDPVSGNVYVSDGWFHCIQAFDSSGNFLWKRGSTGRTNGQFIIPMGMDVGADGNVYITDYNNHRIQVFDPSGSYIRKWDCGGWSYHYNYPTDIDIDLISGDAYVAMQAYDSMQSKQEVHVYDSLGNLLRRFGGEAGLATDKGVAVDGNANVYVANESIIRNGSVTVFAGDGTHLQTWAAFGSENGKFNSPRRTFIDGNGNVYVVDTNNHRIQVFDGNGNFLRTWGSYGSGDGQFIYPYDVAVNQAGNVYVAEQQRIQVFDSQGQFLQSWGSPGSGDFEYILGLDIGSDGRVYVADTLYHKIKIFDPDGNLLSGWGGPNYPHALDLKVDENDNIYLIEIYAPRVVKVYDTAGLLQRQFSTGFSARSIDVDACGNAYLSSDSNRARIFDDSGKMLLEWGTGGYEDGQFRTPFGISVGSNGWIYVSEFDNHRVQVFEGLESCLSMVADAGPDQVVEQTNPAGAIVSLDGSASSGYCGDEMTYNWTWPGGAAMGVNPLVLMPAGATTVTLSVACGTNPAEDTVNITVQDTMPPATSFVLGGTLGDNGWFISDVTVSLNTVDGGSGVREIRYTLDQGGEVVVPGCAVQITLAGEGPHGLAFYSVDNADHYESPETLELKIDKTPPGIVITGVEDGASYVVGAVPAAGYTVEDAVSGVAGHDAALSGGNEKGLGTFTYTVNATDFAGNTTSLSISYEVVYGGFEFVGHLAEHKPFKLGSTVPVKFQITDAYGNYITDALAAIALQPYSGEEPIGDPIDATSTSGADTGNLFRYDATDNQYIFNLSTDNFSVGTWKLIVSLDDGTEQSIFIGFK